jgi:peptidoglycan/LPS O-acetylase OafA/YrhL
MSEVKNSKAASENHLPILDGLRGIAILQVVLFHLWQLSWLDIGQALHLHIDAYFIPATGYMGVELFFFLSGFCLLYPLAGKHLRGDTLPSWKTYFARRAWKIIPSYWLAIAIALWITSPEHRTVQHILSHIFFIHNWFYETKGSINGVMWSLGVEVQFYCLFPFIAPFFLRRPSWCFALLTGLGLLWRGIVLYYYPEDGFNLSHFNNQMPAALDLFALGMLGAYLVAYCQQKEAEKRRLLFPGWLGLLIALLGGVMLLALLRYLQGKATSGEVAAIQRWQNIWRFPYGFACLLLAVGSALAPKFWKQLLANKLLVFFGFISYNWYLWHQWFAAWLYKTHWVFSQTPEPHDDAQWQPVFFVMVFFGGIQITKWLTEYFEQPLIKWGKKRARPAVSNR